MTFFSMLPWAFFYAGIVKLNLISEDCVVSSEKYCPSHPARVVKYTFVKNITSGTRNIDMKVGVSYHSVVGSRSLYVSY